jgi:hypothetical protein
LEPVPARRNNSSCDWGISVVKNCPRFVGHYGKTLLRETLLPVPAHRPEDIAREPGQTATTNAASQAAASCR